MERKVKFLQKYGPTLRVAAGNALAALALWGWVVVTFMHWTPRAEILSTLGFTIFVFGATFWNFKRMYVDKGPRD